MPRKLMDSSKIHGMGWKPKVPLKRGLSRHTSGMWRMPLPRRSNMVVSCSPLPLIVCTLI
uniref:Uncharacterized protein n=1 Tax=Aegilops tauschii subsp. strangulata TaxID=200361 RepID=A0A453T478_AEGTS